MPDVFYHGRTDGKVPGSQGILMVTSVRFLAEGYAGRGRGQLYQITPKPGARLYNFGSSTTRDAHKFVEALQKALDRGVFPDQHSLDDKVTGESLIEEFCPVDLVNSGEAPLYPFWIIPDTSLVSIERLEWNEDA